jgi:hypothetical protein
MPDTPPINLANSTEISICGYNISCPKANPNNSDNGTDHGGIIQIIAGRSNIRFRNALSGVFIAKLLLVR